MAWVWDRFSNYDLRQDVLEKYLRDNFGNYNFYIKVRTQFGLQSGGLMWP